MPAEGQAPAGGAALRGRSPGAELPRLRLVPAVDAYPAVVEFTRTRAGRIAVSAAFVALALVAHRRILPVAVLPALFPARRRLWVMLGTAAAVFGTRHDVLAAVTARVAPQQVAGLRWVGPAAVLAGWVLTVAYVRLAKTQRARWLARRPVAVLLAFHVAVLATVSVARPSGATGIAAWTVVTAWGSYLWYGAYSLRDGVERRGLALALDACAYHPFWGGSNTPVPKAGSALAKLEVRTPEEAALWQLKAVKLLAWTVVLQQVGAVLEAVASGAPWWAARWIALPSLGIPTYSGALEMSVAGTPYPWRTNGLALVVAFLRALVDVSVWGHGIVAGARMAGFKALRNTYRPLESRTIAEFWNRYYHYFKELLVDFFFFPAFVRCFKRHPRIRLLFATWAAASFGNFLFHYLRDVDVIVSAGVIGALWRRQAYAAYTVLLALAIGASQLRRRVDRSRDPSPLSRLGSAAVVLGTFCLLSIPGEAPPGTTLAQCWRFFLDVLPRA
jgi:hypothetical protein